MADDEDSVIILDEAESPDRQAAPFLHLPLMQNYQNESLNSEIRVAHTALSTAYSSLKTKLSKVEIENRDLKLLLRKRSSQPMAGVGSGQNSRTGTGHPQGGDIGGRAPAHTTANPLLRKHSKRLEDRIESQHKRHGSWAHFNDSSSPSNDGQYLKFLEMQVETHEHEQNTMKDELKSLRLRYTDNELVTSKVKQENLRLERENKLLQQQYNHRNHRDDQTNQNEELRKMNICLQNQLKTAVEKHDKLVLINSQLEERLEQRIGEQERMYETQARLTRAMAATERPMAAGYSQEQQLYDAMMELDGRLDSEDVTLLQRLIAMVKQQLTEVTELKQIVKKQQKIISGLMYSSRTEATRVPGGSLNTTLEPPITCVDDLSPSNTPPPHHKIASQNSDDEEGGDYLEPVFTLSTPSRDEINQYILSNADNDLNGTDNGYCDTHRRLTREREPGHVTPHDQQHELSGEEMSDGGVFTEEQEPATIQYNDSEDFVIHHSNEESSQTVVKDLKPSTILHFRQKKEKNRNTSPSFPQQVPGYDHQPPLSPQLARPFDHPSSRTVPTYENHPPPPPSPHRKPASNNGYVNELPSPAYANGVDRQSQRNRGRVYSTINTALMDETFDEKLPRRKRSSLSELPEGFPLSSVGGVTALPVHQYSNSADHLTRCNHKPGYHNNVAAPSRIMSSSTGQLYTQGNTSAHHPVRHVYNNITDNDGSIAISRKTSSGKYVNVDRQDQAIHTYPPGDVPPTHPPGRGPPTYPPGHVSTHPPTNPHVGASVANRSSPVRYMDSSQPAIVPQGVSRPPPQASTVLHHAPPQGSTLHHRAPSRHVYDEVVEPGGIHTNPVLTTKRNINREEMTVGGGAPQDNLYMGFTVNQQQNTVGGYSINQRQQQQEYNDHLMTKNLHPKVNDVNSADNHVTLDQHLVNRTQVSSMYLSNTASGVDMESSRPYENVEPKIPPTKTPSPHQQNNMESTYLKVRLPPVENTESASNNTVDSNNTLSDNTSETATCPVCTQLFPVIGSELQAIYEAHVDHCLLANGQLVARSPVTPPHINHEDEFRKCPMCQEKFYIVKVDQQAFERHVQSHFDADIVNNFEMLNI